MVLPEQAQTQIAYTARETFKRLVVPERTMHQASSNRSNLRKKCKMNVHRVFPVSDVAYTPERLLLHAPQNYQASKKAKINTISVYLQHCTIYNASEQHFHEIFQTLSPDLILKEFEAYLAMEVSLSLQIKEVSNSVK